VNFVPISPFAGVECFDPLSFPLSHSDSAAIRDAVHRSGVVVFRGQDSLGDAEQIELASVLGEPVMEPPSKYADGYTKLTTVSHRKESGFGSAEIFHCDGVFDGVPIAGLCLRVVEHPQFGGGDTVFCSFARVWDSLSPGFRQLFKGLTVRYSFLPPVAARRYLRTTGASPVDVPLVFRHPVTGADSLFFSQMGARDIPELSEDEASSVFALLREHISRFANQVRVRWSPGTVVLLDNTAGCHAVSIDYLPEPRRVSRVVLRGVPLERSAPAFESGFPVGFVSSADKKA
jgi:taurine dioxygenase